MGLRLIISKIFVSPNIFGMFKKILTNFINVENHIINIQVQNY